MLCSTVLVRQVCEGLGGAGAERFTLNLGAGPWQAARVSSMNELWLSGLTLDDVGKLRHAAEIDLMSVGARGCGFLAGFVNLGDLMTCSMLRVASCSRSDCGVDGRDDVSSVLAMSLCSLYCEGRIGRVEFGREVGGFCW